MFDEAEFIGYSKHSHDVKFACDIRDRNFTFVGKPVYYQVGKPD